MEKIIELSLRPNGCIVQTESKNEETLGKQGESGAGKIRLHLPNNVNDFHHYLEFLAPSGDSKSSEPLEKVVISGVTQDYIEMELVEPFIGEFGMYAIQYVGRVESSNRCIKSDIIRLEVEESICAANTMEHSNPDWIAWATRKFQDFETRIQALENDEHSEVKADADFGINEIILVSDGVTKKVKASSKTVQQILSDAAEDASSKAQAAQSAAASDATSKVSAEAQRASQQEQALALAVAAKQDAITPQTVLQVKKLIGGLEILTTAPTADNPDGIKIVLLPVEPEHTYQGYLYIFEN